MSLPLDRDTITLFVANFYGAIRQDRELGPIFDARIGDHWQEHLARLAEFWSTVMLGTREYKGNVFGKHMVLSEIEPHHFARWLALFEANAAALFAPDTCTELMTTARRIAASLQLGLSGERAAVDAGPTPAPTPLAEQQLSRRPR
ncbi:MAG: globin-like protein [Massilia sp.]|jgi:hemoglobin|nr:globin-like protein [Massilia sp.]